MKYILVVLLCTCLFCQDLIAQYTSGLTGVRDTSYNTNKAYASSKKSNPETAYIIEPADSGLTIKKSITYKKIENRKLKLDVFQPVSSAKSKRIAVIIIHGGGWRSGNKEQHHAMAKALAHKGYVCFTPEYRLSTEALFPAAIYDLKEAIRWVKLTANKYQVDSSKLALIGFSAGGEMAAFLANTGDMPLFSGKETAQAISTKVAALVDIDGTLSFTNDEQKEGDDSKRISAATHWFGYSRKDNFALWQAASPVNYAGANSPPTLFLNSSVKSMQAGQNEYIAKLCANGIYSEVHEFKNAPHSFSLFEPWFTPTIKYIDTFLQYVFSQTKTVTKGE